MFDIGWSELAVIAVVALIVIGPRDLPRVLYTAGKMAGKARAMLREVQQSIEDIGREAELEDMRKKIESVRDVDLHKQIRNSIDPKGEIEAAFDTDVERRPAAAPADTQTSASAVEPPQPAEAPQSDDPPPVRP